jgi:RND family efflux transporter MFP subunit
VTQRYRVLAALALAIASYTYYSVGAADPQDGRERAAKKVRVGAAIASTDQRELRFSGVTRAADRAKLAFSVNGRLVQRSVEVGDTVRRGQVVAKVDDAETRNGAAGAKATLAELKARRAQVERDVERVSRLVSVKAATTEELEKTQAGLDALRAGEEAAAARLRETERWLGETSLKAPFDGTVTEVLKEVGEVVSPGQTVLTLSGAGDVELEVELPESVMPQLQVGQAVSVQVPMLGAAPIAGQVSSVGRTAAGPGRLFPVIVKLDAGASTGKAAVGATAELLLKLGSASALAVPVEAVVDPGGRRPSVFRVVGGKVQKVSVEVGALVGRHVTVKGDLQPGDELVVGGQRGLLDGEAVEVVR